jgi:hypothetical protein
MDPQFQNGSVPQKSEKFYLPTFIVVILLIIIHPIGLLAMWVFSSWSKKVKLIITFGPILLAASLLFLMISTLNTSQMNALKQEIKNPNQVQSGVNR